MTFKADLANSGFSPHAEILVTGAAGFIGSRLVQQIVDTGLHVIALDNLSVGLPLPQQTEAITPIVADIRNAQAMSEVFDSYKPEAIIHLAALHHIPTCEAKPHLALDINVLGTQVILDQAQSSGCQNIILASSGAVYDWADGPLSEDTSPVRARDIYATTKLTNEYQLSTWTDRSGFRAHIARLFNVIGLHDPNAHLIPDIVKQLGRAEKQCVIKLGNLTPRRDYIYVDDVAAGLVAMLMHLKNSKNFDTFNLCTGSEASVSELVLMLGELAGTDVELQQDSARMRKVDRMSQLGNPSRSAQHLGWTARTSLRTALAEIVAYNAHQRDLAAA